jgi:hypothetical protein
MTKSYKAVSPVNHRVSEKKEDQIINLPVSR